MKKRLLALVLSALMILSLAACSGGGGNAGTPAPDNGGTPASSAPPLHLYVKWAKVPSTAAVRKPVRGQNRHRLPIMTSRPKKWKHSI